MFYSVLFPHVHIGLHTVHSHMHAHIGIILHSFTHINKNNDVDFLDNIFSDAVSLHKVH